MSNNASFEVVLNGTVELNGLQKEALEAHLHTCMMRAIGDGLITGHTEAEVDEYHLSVAVEESGASSESEPSSAVSQCPKCEADLTKAESVVREYVNKRSDSRGVQKPSVYADGHYENGCFESDSFDGFGGCGNDYDLLDDSDSCAGCGEPL